MVSTPPAARTSRAKRALDLTVAGTLLVAFSPLLAAIGAVVRWRLGRPVLFRQARPGLEGRLFTLFKFRTMREERSDEGTLLSDAERLTRFGRALRATSLDELPELVNVLRGDMSLVGPRPLLVEYLEHYDAEQARRHLVRPGLTGLAQVRGRNASTWEDRLAADVEYVDTWSLGLDLRILVRTVASVLRREGISNDGHATMPRFDAERG
jgi:lipopolysaccharide/colanic/teichoic acid biosynthesis glycosyltransferase